MKSIAYVSFFQNIPINKTNKARGSFVLGLAVVGLTGPHSNYKMLSEKVKQVKASAPIEAESDAELIDISYDPDNGIGRKVLIRVKHSFFVLI